MGIKGLSGYIKRRGVRGTSTLSLKDLEGWRIAVDASIYLYRYRAQDELVSSLYSMVSLLQHYGAELLFVFDGRPPPEKLEELEQRRLRRVEARAELTRLESIVPDGREDPKALSAQIQRLKRQCVRLTDTDIASAKSLLDLMGVGYVTAIGEAETLCAKLVQRRFVDAVLSDDTDMFMYGCGGILRYLSLLHETVVFYSTPDIMRSLNMDEEDFRVVCVLAGTDYSPSHCKFAQVMELYEDYVKTESEHGFHTWLQLRAEWKPLDVNLSDVISLYDLEAVQVPKCVRTRGGGKMGNPLPPDKAELRKFLSAHDFLFAE